MAAESDHKSENKSPGPNTVNAGKIFEWVGSLFFNQTEIGPAGTTFEHDPAAPAIHHGPGSTCNVDLHQVQAHQKTMSVSAVDMVKPRSAMRTTFRSRKQQKRVRFCTAIENLQTSGSKEKLSEQHHHYTRSRSCYPETLAHDSEQLMSSIKSNRCRSMSVREFVIF
ncbi:hypothetical protein GUITHDRAFT_150258 [Guillardia theta CCMP2712]|uniref:Uncharacterized protein n=1 Tax=Guillardia theta (strain CCMP2712) TaxID=905079 RepID=L1JZY1_GUITC|nr:hypothetical protein GUITHDRAFT_150258 [Guillardia theta CCMP2712]EKX53678.1 hypothetical protein GUITHDRAFT_150258 [Guillardia theta CCMP2712]|mmetsp:Transcript_29834/g.95427  ORF Transcript_29834/g.95427 Transcript_29834/m.95427 type:complete len:167 (-) Transcript_29834:47-547(-)|eukprot:XP_005840658.1 hypothetical protein GUITHDRAFT_150258 [Guillardia theta CCMP2712]